ncbi:MAG TPA: NADH-quinone oxidoreductase subunit J [Campylobacteraceae bacterium]|nr:NADH-quinone oxidoreductase subunit J [Campylobacteraceae bacterium]HHD83383.1 NADH-quinone oxidoreductase subunit J [Campylobacteraceae bacterium]
MMEAIAFYLFSAITIGMFLIVVFSKNALYAMSALAGGMIAISGFFFLLDADFLGAVQIIVYTGAVMALYAFGMMFFDTTKEVKENIKEHRIVNALWISAVVMLIVIVSVPFLSDQVLLDASLMDYKVHGANNPQAVGIFLFTKYLVQFELAAVMLLVAMIAGIILVSKKMDVSLTTMDEQVEKEEFHIKEVK